MRREWRWAWAFVLARTVFCAYRASTQSLVHDEAFFYLSFLDGPWPKLWAQFDASNHVLYSALAKLSITLLGLSEFTLRLPSLLAGAAMMWGAFRLLRGASPWVRWIAFAALGLHPMLMDFSIAARGYGLSLAFLVWALEFARGDRWRASGYFLGLGVAANFTLAFPALALVAVQALIQRGWNRLRAAEAMLLPAIATVAVICFLPLKTAALLHFYAGQDVLRESLFNLVYASLHASPREGLFGSINVSAILAFYGIPAIALVWSAVGLWTTVRQRVPPSRLIVCLTLATTVAGIGLAHALFGTRYPVDRTGLYLMLLAGLAWAELTVVFRPRWFRVAMATAAAALLLQFASQLQTRFFWVWWYNGATRDIARLIERRTAGKPPGSVTVSTTFLQQPVLEFYRKQRKLTALAPVLRQEPTPLGGYDYYVLTGADAEVPELEHLHVFYSDPASGTLLATGR